MNKLKTEFKIGIIVLSTIALVIWGINFLKGRNVLKRSDVFYSVYSDIDGLSASAPIMLNGYKVGMVNKISFKKDQLDEIIVAYTVGHQYDIPKGSVAELYNAGIMGGKSIKIIPSKNKEYHHFGDTLKSSTEKGLIAQLQNEFIPLKDKIESLTTNADSLILGMRVMLNENSSFNQAISNLSLVSAQLKAQFDEGGQLNETISALQKFSVTLSENRGKIDTLFDNFASISDSIAQANIMQSINYMESTFSETSKLLAKINAGEGSLGMMSTNDSLYVNVTSATQSLDLLLKDLQNNPKRYVHFSVFGKRDK
jgi:phospholipid/cholesterol/gamma-HCH transport system substrate-binding protein